MTSIRGAEQVPPDRQSERLDALPHRGSRMRRCVDRVWRMMVLLVWAVWWGGLTFYATLVVPVATDQFGSVGQGFVTQRVTAWHNMATVVVLVVFAIEAFRHRSKTLAILICALAVNLVMLCGVHRQLTGLMDFATRSVPDGFYEQHAWYLWLTTVEWGAGGALVYWLTASRRE